MADTDGKKTDRFNKSGEPTRGITGNKAALAAAAVTPIDASVAASKSANLAFCTSIFLT
jgi:hypothetical protein